MNHLLDAHILQDKVAVITGAAQGMGKAIAQQFLESGALVAICDINEQSIRQTATDLTVDQSRIYSQQVDVSDYQNFALFIGNVLRKFQKIDILVNNAGIIRPTRLENIDVEEWKNILDVNVNGVFYGIKLVLPHMMKANYGRIINMASIAGRSVSTQGGAHYTASKAAVLGITRATAKEMGKYSITSNAICPGLIDTPMARKASSPEDVDKFIASYPIKRIGEPHEVADLAVFLASDHAAYITGAAIDINGGDLMI